MRDNQSEIPGSRASIRFRAESTGRQPQFENITPDLIKLWGVLYKRYQFILVCIVVCLGLAVTYSILKRPVYEAQAELNIHPEGSDALNLSDLNVSTGGLDWSAKLATQVRIIQSDTIAWAVIQQLNLDKNPAFVGTPKKQTEQPEHLSATDIAAREKDSLLGRFRAGLSVSIVPQTQIIDVRYRSTDAHLAADIVNALCSSYIEQNYATRFQATAQASTWLTKQLSQLKLRVAESQQRLSDFQRKTGIIGTDENNNLLTSKLDVVSQQVTQAEADRIVKETRYRIAMSGNPDLMGGSLPSGNYPILRKQEAELQDKLAEVETTFGPRYPKVIQLKAQLAQVKEAEAKELQNLQARLKNEYEAALKTENALRASLENDKQKAIAASQGFNQYGILKGELESGRNLYEDLIGKLQEAGVLAGLQSTNIDIVDPARLPMRPVEPNMRLNAIFGLATGLILGVVLVFVLESADESLGSPEEIESVTGLATMGVIPHVVRPRAQQASDGAEISNPALLTNVVSNSAFAEAFRSLRTTLLLATPGSAPQVIAITSAVPEEGKSTISMNCAIALAQQGRRVLLIDADLRRGRIGRELGIATDVGLSEVITGGAKWEDVAKEVEKVPNLLVLPSGIRPPNPAELLGSTQMSDLVSQVRGSFDHIVIDTPPTLAVTDALLLAQSADIVLLVVRCQRSLRRALLRSRDVLLQTNVNLAGTVVNDFSMHGNYYGYGYGYKKYHSYYESREDEEESKS